MVKTRFGEGNKRTSGRTKDKTFCLVLSLDACVPSFLRVVLTEEERVIMRERIGRMFAKSRRG